MLDRPPSSLMSAVGEAVRAGLLVEDGDQLRFRHDLLRESTRQSLPQSLRRAMERQSVSIMLSMGVAPSEVATQLVRSAEPGDREAIDVLRQAARSVSRSDANAAADLSRHALELMPGEDPEHGRLVAETVGLLNRARRYEESEELAVPAMSMASDEMEAEIRLRLPAFTRHNTQRRIGENRRALDLKGITEKTRARHLALLAYNSMLDDHDGQQRTVAEEAAAAAEAIGDLESKVVANLTLSCFDTADGHAHRALNDLEELCALGRTNELPVAHLLAANHYANLLALVGRLDEAADQVASGVQRAQQERNAMVLDVWATIEGIVALAAGRLTAARAAVESLPSPEQDGATELDMVRIAILAQVAIHTDDRNLLQQMVTYAREAHAGGASMVRRTAAYVLALAAWHRDDVNDATRWFGGETNLFGTPMTPQALDQLLLAARVAAAAGDAEGRARVLRTAQMLLRDQPTIPLFAAVAVYVSGIVEDDVEALTAAADMLVSSSRPLLYAAAAEDAGARLVRSGRRVEALEHLNAAFETYSRLGALGDARRVGRELRQLGVERRITVAPRAKTGWDSLTDAELKVLGVVADGATNRAVADQLHLSLHTVKTHVHNAFTKLNISSRSQLAHVMG
jgi:DNA-binding CsgD family transcriptional regulator